MFTARTSPHRLVPRKRHAPIEHTHPRRGSAARVSVLGAGLVVIPFLEASQSLGSVAVVAFESRRQRLVGISGPKHRLEVHRSHSGVRWATVDGWVILALVVHCIAWACWLGRFFAD